MFRRFFYMTSLVLRAHIFNWFWRNKRKRRAVRRDVLSSVIPGYLKHYLPAAGAVKESTVVKDDANEKIYSLWLQGEDAAPALVKACARSVRRNCTQELVVLDKKSLFDKIDLPGVIVDKYNQGKIAHAHFADIARVELLHNHGGFWLDATGFVTSPIPDWIINEDFFVYLAGSDTSYKFAYSFMQNCFIRARKGSYLLDAWRAMILEYWKKEPKNFDYFMHQLMFKTLVENDPRAIEYFAKMPHVAQDPTHALWWKYRDMPFDKALFDKVTSGAFFQKTAYKDATNPIPGSFVDVMIKM
ncbi:MAG TPA: capsular polysaccharide synthesis protein [Alphaproteobacteria bacterium]|nr:capsular polysaccharide synthesis protein [Alphaproteobacteria bacterium]